MARWIKKNTEEVEVSKELEYENSNIAESNAYEAEITECRLAESSAQGSKSVSLVVGIKTDDGETNKTYFTVMGRDGETYFTSTYQGKTIKKQHFGLSIADTLFQLVIGKEIFDVEPEEVEFKSWNKEDKAFEDKKGEGFPELIGKKIGACVQLTKEISGADSKEYGTIEHFFDLKSGLMFGEDPEAKKTKLSKWLGSMKDYKIVEKEAQNKTSFGSKDKGSDAPSKSKWGK